MALGFAISVLHTTKMSCLNLPHIPFTLKNESSPDLKVDAHY